MKIMELGHIVLFVRDLAKSVHFYRDILGFDAIEPARPGKQAFTSGRTHHELLLIEVGKDAPLPVHGRRAGLYHFGLKIGNSLEELKAAKADMEAAGVHIVGISDHTVSKSLYILDPDGNELEVYVDADPAIWQNDPSAVLTPTKPLYL
ncbi:MAG: putative Glyoxalase [Chloroflexi bacterium]|jgi:catechol 2,3-dioxygenase|nr:putative Glyoxalase [Chloroflexota bacterium]